MEVVVAVISDVVGCSKVAMVIVVKNSILLFLALLSLLAGSCFGSPVGCRVHLVSHQLNRSRLWICFWMSGKVYFNAV